MKRLISSLTVICSLNAFAASETASNPCSRWIPILKPVCQRIHQTWTEGHDDMYFRVMPGITATRIDLRKLNPTMKPHGVVD